MFKNFLKTAWRNLSKNKGYSALNILGLATGMAVALLIGLWVHFQLSFDRHIEGYEQVYKVGTENHENGKSSVGLITPYPLSVALKKDIPGIRYAAVTDWIRRHSLVNGEKKISLAGAMAGADFLNIFLYPLVQGNRDEALKDPYSIVLTESTAKALFGDLDPMDKFVRIDNVGELKVTGILKDLKPNSTVRFNYIVPFDYYAGSDENVKRAMANWGQVTFHTYLALEPHVTYASLKPQLDKLLARYNPEGYAKSSIYLKPMKDWHLFTSGEAVGDGFVDYVKMFALIGILVLAIACINFINLSTARSEKRAKEVGIRKVMGSRRSALILQFLVESVMMTFLSFLIALLIVIMVLPSFNQLTDSSVSIPWTSSIFWIVMIGYVLLTGLLAGARPAFYLSGFVPVAVLKGNLQQRLAAFSPGKLLVVLQFTCSITLIISTIIIYQQIEYGRERERGYSQDRLMMTDASTDIKRNFEALRNELLASGAVTAVTGSSSAVTENSNFNSIEKWPGSLPGQEVGVAKVYLANGDYFHTMGMKLVQGRSFQFAGDSTSVILNESAINKMHLTLPVNQLITWDGIPNRRIIGVVRDALMGSPFSNPQASLFAFAPAYSRYVTYRLSAKVDDRKANSLIAPIFNKYNPAFPFEYKFIDEDYAAKFTMEMLVGKLSGVFAALAIFISCIGLFSLAAFTAEQRRKEIGIRKVLGASVSQVWILLSKEFVALVVLSSVIASPIAFYVLSTWLEKYSYRVEIGAGVFIIAALLALGLTVVTVSFQSVRAAVMSPVNSMKVG